MVFRVHYQMNDGRVGLAVFTTKEQANRFERLCERQYFRVISVDDKPQDLKFGTHARKA